MSTTERAGSPALARWGAGVLVVLGLAGVTVWQSWADPSDGRPGETNGGPGAPGVNATSEVKSSDEQRADGVNETETGRQERSATHAPDTDQPSGIHGGGSAASSGVGASVSVPPDDAAASGALAGALEEQTEVLSEVAESAPPLEADLSSGAGQWAGALVAQAIEYEAMGWSQVGTPKVASAEVVAGSFNHRTSSVEVLACLDSSEVDVVDAAGRSLRNEGTPDRSAHLFTLEFREGSWILVGDTFPDEPDC